MRIIQPAASSLILTVFAVGITGCVSPAAAREDLVLREIYTSVAITLAAATDRATPTAALAAASTAFPTITPYPASSATATSSTGYYSYASGCDNAAYVRDVTIADGTEVAPGETFTKTWEFLNTGSCDWSSRYSITFISGSDMDGSGSQIDETVNVGEHGEISVVLTAPEDEGTYTGYWRMASASGTAFGAQVYVQIVVTGAAATSTPTPTSETATATGTPTPTSTASSMPIPTHTPTSTSTPIPIETPRETTASTAESIPSPTPEASTE